MESLLTSGMVVDATCPESPPGDSLPTTYFAPAGRYAQHDLEQQSETLHGIPFLRQVLDAMPHMVMVVNDKRQIVAANETFLQLLGTTITGVFSKRPGEALGCLHARQAPDGCGTTVHCVTCGAVQAILESQQQTDKVERECSVLVDAPQGIRSLDLRITAMPMSVGYHRFVIVIADDISRSKRLDILQRTFFHDVLNVADCINGYAQYFVEEPFPDNDSYARLADLTGQLIETIAAQRDLLHAEAGDLAIKPLPVSAGEVLYELRQHYLSHYVAKDRTILLGDIAEATIITDRRLLDRILANMMQNALEASSPGTAVTLACSDEVDRITFSVHNAGVMPDHVRLQIFHRSFSTKGQSGRGLGTYSMKLLGEQYLGGKVSFCSNAGHGTTFMITLPKTIGG